jgi:hypothetical protein
MTDSTSISSTDQPATTPYGDGSSWGQLDPNFPPTDQPDVGTPADPADRVNPNLPAYTDLAAAAADAGVTTDTTVDDGRPTFAPGYPVTANRIYRARLYPGRYDGVATVTFRGNVADATQTWVSKGASGRISLYAEVTPTDDTATEIRVAVVPTGKRVPDDGYRIGSVDGTHVYLLTVDGTVDRVAYDQARAARKAERAAQRATDLGWDDGDDREDGWI